MDSVFYSTLLNTKIAKFYEIDQNVKLKDVQKYFCANRTLNFTEIAKLLAIELEELKKYKYEDYLGCYQKLQPIFIESQKVTEEVAIKELNMEWLGSSFPLSDENNENVTTTVEQVLLLTALLENALANVFYTITDGRTPPHLLRDLLSSSELKNVFSAETIIFLKILLGTPLSINLRNIVWHGFPKPNEIPTFFVPVLLLTIHSLGCKLETKEFQLLQRPQISDFSPFLNKIENEWKNSEFHLNNNAQEWLISCCWLSEEHKLYWQQLFRYYTNQNYGKLVILILPQIELLLRLIYGQANEYDIRAKLDEYYITMDSIFESNVPVEGRGPAINKKNKLLLFESNLISEGSLKYMYDLFAAPNGPRLRDKVSHGEVTRDAINNQTLCGILLRLSLNLLTKNELEFSLAHYESKFHLNCLTKETLSTASEQLQHFFAIHFANELPFTRISFSMKVKIFHRPKKEPELMNLVLKICQLIEQTCLNYEDSISERRALLEQRELHSKRRRTLEKLLAALPQICDLLWEVLKCMEKIFVKLQHENEEIFCDGKQFDKLLRFLKHTLKTCENFVKYSDKDSNEWIKALELCKNFSELRERLFEEKSDKGK